MDHSAHSVPQIPQTGLTYRERIADFFSEYGFMPHGHCYLWKPWLVGLHVVSDLLIGLAYLSISITLYGLVKKTNIQFNRIVLCFGVFIGACGLTHFMEIWNLWNADYWWAAWIKVITATASVFTGIYLYKLRDTIVEVAQAAKLAEKHRLDLEALLNERTEDFNTIANSIPQLAWKTDATGYITWYNQRWYDYTGTMLEEMQGWGWQKVHHPDHEKRVSEKWSRHLTSGEDWEDVFPLKGKDDSYRWFLSRARPSRDASGKITHWFGTNTDITEEMEVRAELERQKILFEAVVNQMPAGVVVAEAPSGKLIYGSERLKDVWGYNLIEADHVEDYIKYVGYHPDGTKVKGHEWPLARSLAQGVVIKNEVYEIERGDGKRGMVRLSSAPVKDASGKTVAAVVVSEDVTEEKRTQLALLESEEKFKTIANAMPQMIWSTLPDGFHDYYNDRWYEFTGVPYGSTDGEGWNGMFHPDDQERAWKVWNESLETGKDYEIEYRLRHHSGDYRWVLGRALPIRNEDGRITRWMGTLTDIHDQLVITEELHSTTIQLQKAVSARDEFLSIASHELKTPLTSLRLNSQVLEKKILSLEAPALEGLKLPQFIDQTLRQIDRLNRLVDDMLDISRIQSGKLAIEKTSIQFKEFIYDIASRFNAQFINETGSPLKIEGSSEIIGHWDRLRIEQVLANILTNALKYGNKKTVSMTYERQGENILIAVKDQGPGISLDKQEAIFERFERAGVSANDVSGLGLGLFISRQIVLSHNGRIWVESAPGMGATFYIELPVGKE